VTTGEPAADTIRDVRRKVRWLGSTSACSFDFGYNWRGISLCEALISIPDTSLDRMNNKKAPFRNSKGAQTVRKTATAIYPAPFGNRVAQQHRQMQVYWLIIFMIGLFLPAYSC
jgi:hypothetical protein